MNSRVGKAFALAAVVYGALAVVAAATSAATDLGALGPPPGIRWIRIHLVTLGVFAQAFFGLLPGLLGDDGGTGGAGQRWLTWSALNAGLLSLLLGIPHVTASLIHTGGALVAVATLSLAVELLRARGRDALPTRFAVTGLAYLLLGILAGTGLWQPWLARLGMGQAIEVHIHANGWGFASFVFVAVLLRASPSLFGAELLSPRAATRVYVGMTLGALGLVLGPWLRAKAVLAPGLLLHLVSTIFVLRALVGRARERGTALTPGAAHLLSAWVWILAPVVIAPLVVFGVKGFSAAGIEQNAPQALVWGWVLGMCIALLPWAAGRLRTSDAPAQLGGTWGSLALLHAGGVLLWASIFAADLGPALHGLAYVSWALALAWALASAKSVVTA
jgi:hypothetical protein